MAYTPEEKTLLLNTIFDKISNGMSLRNVLKDSDMPNRNTFFEWIEKDVDLANQYARACEDRAELIFEDILHIADDTTKDTQTVDFDGIEIEQINHDAIQRSRLRVDARKWMLSKMMPKKFGDTSKITLEGGDKPINISFED